MTRVLALVDGSACSSAVHRTAANLADRLGFEVDAVHVEDPSDGEPPPQIDDDVRVVVGDTLPAIEKLLREDNLAAAVLGSRATHGSPLGHVALAVVTDAPVPLIVLPPGHPGLTGAHTSVMVPLDGSKETTAAVAPLVAALSDAGAHMRLVHFFDSASLPPFLETAEDVRVLADEFRRHHLTEQAEVCDLRLGDPAHHMIKAALDQPTDAMLIAWSQRLDPGRGEVVRRLLRESPIPVIATPIGFHVETT